MEKEKTVFCGSGKTQNEKWLKATINIDKIKDHKYIQRTFFNGKTEPYYDNEWDYGRIPTYNFNELNDQEINFYYNFKKTNKQTDEHRTTVV